MAHIKLFSKKDKVVARKIEKTILEKAVHDWKILLLSAIILGLIVVAIDGYLLWRVNNGDIFVAEIVTETDTTLSDKRMLENVVKFFEDRSVHFETLKNSSKLEIDPSL